MTLGQARQQFTAMTVPLITRATLLGYRPVIDFTKRCDDCKVGHPKSLHKLGLAVDLHLYRQDGTYITDDTGHRELHEYWEILGGAPMIEGDSNHYSLSWEGMR